ncbi:hypothetical protein AMELA_G00110440, partial [Ameiurus melas]
MNTKNSVIVLFLCFLTLFTLTDCSTCQKNILEGGSLAFKLTDRQLKDDDRFTISKDNKLVVPKRTRKQAGPGIVINDSLEFQDVKLSDSGTYSVEVFDVNGNNIKSYSEIICVYAKVPKPRVTITCQDATVDFRCDVELEDKDQRSNISYSWHKNGKEFKKYVFNFSVNIEADKSEYTCTAQNPVHTNTSDPVEACSDTLFGFERWTMIGIFAGGGLVLLLTIVLVTVACCRCKRRKKQQDKEQFRLKYFNVSPTSGQQKAKQTESQQLTLLETYDNVSPQQEAQVPCQTESRPIKPKRTRPPPPPIDDEEEQPPPLPKPRRNA